MEIAQSIASQAIEPSKQFLVQNSMLFKVVEQNIMGRRSGSCIFLHPRRTQHVSIEERAHHRLHSVRFGQYEIHFLRETLMPEQEPGCNTQEKEPNNARSIKTPARQQETKEKEHNTLYPQQLCHECKKGTMRTRKRQS